MKRARYTKGGMIILVALLVVCLLSGSVWAKNIKLTFGVGLPADPLPFIKAVRDYWAPEIKKRVEAQTDHTIEWTLHFSGSVVKLTDGFEAVKDGLLDVSIAFPIFENPALFIHNFSYYAPFGTSDTEIATQVNLGIYDKNPWLKTVFEKKHNQKWLATFTYESYDLVTNFPIASMDDLKNHKIAAAGPNLPWIKTVGCVPVQSNVGEAYTGLQTGVVEGWVLPTSAIWAFKLTDVAKYVNEVGFGCISAGSLTMNLDVFNALPKEVQSIILEVGPDYAMQVARDTKAKHNAALEEMKKKGVNIFSLSEEQKGLWMKKLGSLAKDMAKEADGLGQPGTKVLKDYVAEMAAAGHKWPITWEIE